jgi:hypothetical protein
VKFAGRGTLLGEDTVIIVEDFLSLKSTIDLGLIAYGTIKVWRMPYVDGDKDINTLVLLPRPCSVVPFFTRVVTHDEGSLGELLEEAFRGGAVDVEEERVRDGEEREEGDEGPHLGGGGRQEEAV